MSILTLCQKRSVLDIINMWLKTKTDIKIQSKQKYEQIVERYVSKEFANRNIKKVNSNDFIL